MFTVPFCQALLEELEHFEQSDMPKGRPNTMNNYGVGEAGALGVGGTYCGAGELLGPIGVLVFPSVK